MSKKLLAVITAAIVMTSCRQAQTVQSEQAVNSELPVQHLYNPPKSEVLALLEKNGAGDASKSSLPAFRRWFSTRAALAEQVVKMCEPIEGNATVAWGDSAEATACTAAQETSAAARRTKAWTFVPPVADKRGW